MRIVTLGSLMHSFSSPTISRVRVEVLFQCMTWNSSSASSPRQNRMCIKMKYYIDSHTTKISNWTGSLPPTSSAFRLIHATTNHQRRFQNDKRAEVQGPTSRTSRHIGLAKLARLQSSSPFSSSNRAMRKSSRPPVVTLHAILPVPLELANLVEDTIAGACTSGAVR